MTRMPIILGTEQFPGQVITRSFSLSREKGTSVHVFSLLAR